MSYQQEFIEFMIKANVLKFGDFTAKSGRKTPYFINTGNYQTGEQLSRLGDYYAECIVANHWTDFDLLFGPAYKGIPLAAATAISLYCNHGINVPYCYNRKEAKDHGEGGSIVGYQPKDGDRVLIIEDVITAGTAARESLALLSAIAAVNVTSIVISVDRMERGAGNLSALQELQQNYGMKTFSIVTVREIIQSLYNKEVDGRVVIDDMLKERMEAYLKEYGAAGPLNFNRNHMKTQLNTE